MQTYTGGCHCGKVKYEVDAEHITSALSCNCSLCSKRGWLLSFVPASQFRLLTGEENLTEYRFNTKIIQHLFCDTCGVASFGRGTGPDGTEMVSINVRCLDNLDVETLSIQNYDGKNV